MSVPADLATMGQLVWTNLKDTLVSVQRGSLDFSVRMRCLTVWREPVQTELCARIFLDPTTSNACAEMDLREKNVTSQLIHALRMAIHVVMVHHAEHCLKVDTLASALRVGRDHTVRTTLMIVWNSLVFLEPTAQIWSMTSDVTAPEDLLEKDVRKRRTCVQLTPVSEVNVWTNCSDMSVSVSLAGLDLTVMSILMIVPAVHVRTMVCALIRLMATTVFVSQGTLVTTVNTLWTTVLMNPARMEEHATMKEMDLFVSADLASLAVQPVRQIMMNAALDLVIPVGQPSVWTWRTDLNVTAEMVIQESFAKPMWMTVNLHPAEMEESARIWWEIMNVDVHWDGLARIVKRMRRVVLRLPVKTMLSVWISSKTFSVPVLLELMVRSVKLLHRDVLVTPA